MTKTFADEAAELDLKALAEEFAGNGGPSWDDPFDIPGGDNVLDPDFVANGDEYPIGTKEGRIR